ncbi:unnamed protein product [Gongylonema pulchrum]|uniref:Smg4_UPF3 domain-containing protein n=1 Tax=Gongylonema pulchrum TaxID=637853 RepID=A0A183EA82_9BILA|nr:unnamed protein product [Gongylonema pulchrum]
MSPLIVLRRLPAAMTREQLETQLAPLPELEFFEFISARPGGPVSFAQAYFAFKNEDEIVPFKERFHGYVFVDNKGNRDYSHAFSSC